jgi:hypothetical protein
MLNASLYYDTRYKTQKGHPLKVRFLKDGKYYYTKALLYIQPENWDLKTKLPKKSQDYQFALTKKASLINEENFCVKNELTPDECKVVFEKGVDEPEAKEIELAKLKARIRELEMGQDKPFQEVFNEYLSDLSQDASTLTKIRSVRQFFIFRPNIGINEISLEVCKDFVRWLQLKGVKNGAYAYMNQLGSVYTWSKGRKVENPFYLARPKLLEQKKKKPFSQEDIKLIENFKSDDEDLILRVKIFLLQFYLGGIDLMDLGLLTYSKNYYRGRISFKRYKNRNKRYGGSLIDIRVFPKAKEIMDSFKDGDRIVPSIPIPIINNEVNKKYNTFLVGNNKPLRAVAKELGLNESISSKVSRNTFKTIGRVDLKLDNEILMNIQGHALTGVDKRYQDDFDYESQDSVHWQVINTT